MGSVSIRPAERGDLQLVAQLIRELAAFERLTGEVVFDEPTLERYLFGEHRYAEVLIAESQEDGAALGFALFFHTFSTFLGRPGLYLEDLFVRAESRGRGVGRALLGELARIAVERGNGRIEWAVLDWNAGAIAFYKSIGANPNDDWTTFRLEGEAMTGLGADESAPLA